jgi:hypothetical protein
VKKHYKAVYTEMKSTLAYTSTIVALMYHDNLLVHSLTTTPRRQLPRIRPSLIAPLYDNPQSDADAKKTISTESSKTSLSYDDSDSASKGLVSSLTNLVNSLSGQPPPHEPLQNKGGATAANTSSRPPTSPMELLQRIQADYVERNYLWTGNLDLACFQDNCRFTDPTLTFQGTDTFTKNTQNLVPLVERFCEKYQSRLLEIELHDGYVQTRWNMVGSVTRSPLLFWKPRIDVIGRTKFWYQKDDHECKVYFYDEEWEIPAYQALLQLVTPAGTFPNTRLEDSR